MTSMILAVALVAVIGAALAAYRRQHRRIVALRAEAESLRGRLGEDLLTGLGNIRQLRPDWNRLAALGRRHRRPFSAVVVEVEDAAHPEVPISADDLKRIAARLSDTSRDEDHVYRVDSRRFAVLLANCGLAGAQEYVERLHGRLSVTPAGDGPGNIYLTVVCGVAEWDGRFGSWRDHMRAALNNTVQDRATIAVRRSRYAEPVKAGADH